MKAKLFSMAIASLLMAALLSGCGGGSGSTGTVRLVNATHDFAALELYTSDTERASGVAESTASGYIELDEGSYSFRLKTAGSSTTSLSSTLSVAKDTAYSIVAYNTGSTLGLAYFSDNQSAPTSGTAALRLFNGAPSAGTLDVYVTATDADLATASPAVGSLSGATLGSYAEFGKGTYRIRVTGAGDKTDLRLDIPAITLADQQVATLVLTGSGGGVLVNGLLVNQGGTVAAFKNGNARVRVVAAVTGNGSVSASTASATLASSLQSPSVGGYVSTPATLDGLSLKVNGVAIDTSTISVAAGDDVTLLVYGDAASPQLNVLFDDNLPATLSSNTRIRLVNLVNGLGSTTTLNADYVAVADNIAFGYASAPASIAASTTMRLEVTSPLRTTPLYSATDVSLAAQKVYTLFMMGDAASPIAVLRKDR
ncbi:MAG TPA: DUF4397 domain-containing protein [Albitalea sp.]|nr:DUF4397 domain-containing protein [Albitalea sp.]